MKNTAFYFKRICAVVLALAIMAGTASNGLIDISLRAAYPPEFEESAAFYGETELEYGGLGEHEYSPGPEYLPPYDGDEPGYYWQYKYGEPGYPGYSSCEEGEEPQTGWEDDRESEPSVEEGREPELGEEEIVEPGETELDFALYFSFDGDLYISPEMYRGANRTQLFLRGVRVTDESGQRIHYTQVVDDGGFYINAAPGTVFVITYAAIHPVSGEIFGSWRTATVIPDEYFEEEEYEYTEEGYEAAEPEVTFAFEGDLAIEISELHENIDTDAVLLQGITAEDQYGEDISHLIAIYDDGEFARRVEEVFAKMEALAPRIMPGLPSEVIEDIQNIGQVLSEFASSVRNTDNEPEYDDALDFDLDFDFDFSTGEAEAEFTAYVRYVVAHPETGEEFVSEPRAVAVSFELIVPFTGRIVTFRPNGGQMSNPQGPSEAGNFELRETIAGNVVGAGNFPNPEPFRLDFAFRHWNTSPTLPGTLFTETTVVPEGGRTVYAQWGREVNFNLQAPELTPAQQNIPARIVPHGFSVNNMPVTTGAPAVTWPTPPNRPGFSFVRWRTSAALGSVTYTADTPITRQTFLYAEWLEANPYTVTFSVNGGTLGGGHQATRQARPGMSIAASWPAPHLLNQGVEWPRSAPSASRPRPNPTPNGNVGNPVGNVTLSGWTEAQNSNTPGQHFAPTGTAITESAGNHINWSNRAITGNTTVHARWVFRVTFETGTAVTNPTRDVIVNPTTAMNGGTIAALGTTTGNPSVANPGSIAAATSLPGAPSRPGFTFHGWWNVNLPDNTTDAEIAAMNPQPRQLTANCLINSSGTVWALWRDGGDDATVTFNIGGGSWTAQPQEAELGLRNLPAGSTVFARWGQGIGNVISPPTPGVSAMPRFPTRPGYVFTGWFVGPQPLPTEAATGDAAMRTNTGDGGRRFGGNSQVPAGGFTVYARWLPYHEVIFNSNGGTFTGQMATDNIRNIPNGWTFLNMETIWGTMASGAPLSNFYFNAWHGTGTTRAEHTFFGWNTEQNGAVTTGTQLGETTTVNGPMTVYAMWAPTISFNNNHSSVLSGAADLTTTRNVLIGRTINNHHQHPNTPAAALTLPSATTGTPGFWGALPVADRAFVGWNFAQDGSGEWFTADTVIEPGPNGYGPGPFTVYAIWSHGVAFDSGVAPENSILAQHRYRRVLEFDPPIPLSAAMGSVHFPQYSGMPPAPVWPGNTFRHWQTAAGTTIDAATLITGPMRVYAQWAALVTFNANGGTLHGGGTTRTAVINIDTPPLTLGAEYEGPPSAGRYYPTRTGGWSFAAWENSAGLVHTPTAPPITYGRTLYAQWAADITFDLNYGAGPAATWPAPLTGSANITHAIREGESIATTSGVSMPATVLNPPTRTGSNFLGWFTVPGATGGVEFTEDIIAGSANFNGHTTVYARWDTTDAALQLVVVGYTFGSASATAPNPAGGPPQTITVNSAAPATMQVQPNDTVSLTLELATAWENAPHNTWIQASVTVGSDPPVTIVMPLGTAPHHTFTMPATNTTVTVTFQPSDQWGFALTEASLDYGTHLVDMAANQNIALGTGIGGIGTDPADVNFTVFNGMNAPNWQLRVRAETPPLGNDQMASRMFLEGGGSIHGANGVIFTQNTNQLLTTINWNQLDTAVEVRTTPDQPPIAAAHQTDLFWSVHSPISP